MNRYPTNRSRSPAADRGSTSLSRSNSLDLNALKMRLLASQIAGLPDAQSRLYRLAATEAEALACQTPFPKLFLPLLLEEKLENLRRYAAKQEQLRPK